MIGLLGMGLVGVYTCYTCETCYSNPATQTHSPLGTDSYLITCRMNSFQVIAQMLQRFLRVSVNKARSTAGLLGAPCSSSFPSGQLS